MSVYIYELDALDRMTAVEGERWCKLQNDIKVSPQGFYAWLYAWRRLEAEDADHLEPVGTYVEGNDGAIYGEGGVARYRVCRDGEIILLGWSTHQKHIELAKEQGFRVT